MRYRRIAHATLAACILFIPHAASANHGIPFDEPGGSLEECVDENGRPATLTFDQCSWDGEGHLIRSARSPEAEQRAHLQVFGFFAVVWLILVAGSVWWVVSTAKEHGDPMGTALLGALVGGPIFVLLYGSNADIIRRGRRLYRAADALPDTPAPRGPTADAGDRLRKLSQLLQDGSITQTEHDERRREILGEI